MTHQWLFFRLYGAAGTDRFLPAVVPRLARHVRSADPEACFFFQRADGPVGPSVEVWLDAAPDVRREVTERLRREGGGAWRPSIEPNATRSVRYPHESERDVTDELAAVSTEFALAQSSHSRPDAEEAFRLGVTHLRGVVELVPAPERQGFLFLCWQHWSAGLSPGRRVQLTSDAGLEAGMVQKETSEARQTYLSGTRQAIRRQRPGCGLPERYLVFSQAGATHDRLGITPASGAAAALTVRSELVGWETAVPAAMSGGNK